MDEKSNRTKGPEIHADGFEIPSTDYREKRFPNRDHCPKWIQYLALWNEAEIVTALYKATPGTKKYFVESWARTTCPPTCTCSYRFSTEFLGKTGEPEQRVYCNDLDMLALHTNPQAAQYEPPKPEEKPQAQVPKDKDGKRKTHKTIRDLKEL